MLRLCAILLSLLPGGLPVASVEIVRPAPFAAGSPSTQVPWRLASLCAALEVRMTTPPTAPLARIRPQRSDRDGFLYTGRPRKVELVFQDNQLDLVWILVPAQDKDDMLKAFTARYGKPSLQVEFGSIYLAAGAAMRNVPIGVLSTSGRQAHAMMATLQSQSAAGAPSTSP